MYQSTQSGEWIPFFLLSEQSRAGGGGGVGRRKSGRSAARKVRCTCLLCLFLLTCGKASARSLCLLRPHLVPASLPPPPSLPNRAKSADARAKPLRLTARPYALIMRGSCLAHLIWWRALFPRHTPDQMPRVEWVDGPTQLPFIRSPRDIARLRSGRLFLLACPWLGRRITWMWTGK